MTIGIDPYPYDYEDGYVFVDLVKENSKKCWLYHKEINHQQTF